MTRLMKTTVPAAHSRYCRPEHNERVRVRCRPKRGLILLVVLGMLALFTLLAVSFVIAAGASRRASKDLATRAGKLVVSGGPDRVMAQLVRDTNDQQSALYRQSLLGDIYDTPIRSSFGHIIEAADTFRPMWCTRLNVGLLVKVSLDPRDPANTSLNILSDFENAYNSRILTVLEGPLAGQSFRIYKYVGYVRNNARVSSQRADPNLLPPANNNYSDTNSANIDFSVMLDLAEVPNNHLTGQVSRAGRVETVSKTRDEWLSDPTLGLQSLFYFVDNSVNPPIYNGYSFMINGAAFNNAGIGVEEVKDPTVTPPILNFGNIDSNRILRVPRNPAMPRISPALLPNYDYLQDPDVMATEVISGVTGVAGIGNKEPRLRSTQNILRGGTNEGIDVPDYRDYWLGHQSHTSAGRPNIIPSFHRPELVYYIANLFGDPNNMTPTDVYDMLRLIDMASARVMSYQFIKSSNPNFRVDDPTFPRLPASFTWSATPTPIEIKTLRDYVASLIAGPWDVDNDGDGVKESVWVNVNLPTVYSAEGKLLKQLAAIYVEDMDSKINVNLHGNRLQGTGVRGNANDPGYRRVGANLPQGFGYGPADISLNTVFPSPLLLRTSNTNFSIFDDRYGARNYTRFPIDLTDGELDRVPGIRRANPITSAGSFNGNDLVGRFLERETQYGSSHAQLPGATIGRQTAGTAAIDRFGNLSFVHPKGFDFDPYNPTLSTTASENGDDPYESAAMGPSNGDDPFGLDDIEAVMRRWDSDVGSLPPRLVERLRQLPSYGASSEVNRVLTVRQGELRYPNLAAALVTQPGAVPTIETDAGSYMGLIRMLHSQRYRKRSFPPLGSDDPEMTVAAMNTLFLGDFAKGLRLDLNRPFGNGFDDDGDNQVDEPQENYNAGASGNEFFPYVDPTMGVSPISGLGDMVNVSKQFPPTKAQGLYQREIQPLTSVSRNILGSRQLLARQLYCLAQLIIPRDYAFESMAGLTKDTFGWYRVRAAAIAQWAVNVVDFRDSDAAMTRFEYDIFPFGIGAMPPGAPRPGDGTQPIKTAYWSPDTINDSVNGVPNADYTGVVWGLEFPELVLTESLATHDKRARETDLDISGKTTTAASSPDSDFDQYRFPEGSLWLELFATRSTGAVGNRSLAGAPSSLYVPDATGQLMLNLAATAPSAAGWGVQPVWRVGISEHIPPGTTTHPNMMLQTNPASMKTVTNQVSSINALKNNGGIPESIIGSGLFSDLTSTTIPATDKTFDRMIWFTSTGPDATTPVPDLVSAPTNQVNRVYFNRTTYASGAPLVPGGSYVVVGPRPDTTFGSVTKNPLDGTSWAPTLLKATLSTISNRPIKSPSYQGISLRPNSVLTTLLNGDDVLLANGWGPSDGTGIVKNAIGMVCGTVAPIENPLPPPSQRWTVPFPYVGLNVSMPSPINGTGYWIPANKPLVRLNADDTTGSRSDGSYGYASVEVLPDSWVDVTDTASGFFPDHPFDYPTAGMNPILNDPTSPMYQNGTYRNVRVAYLQRLADPEFGYDPVNNPYITVDWISIDLTVFNGEAPFNGTDPDDLSTPATVPPTRAIAFQSRYKDGDSGVNITTGKDTVATPPSQPTAAGARKQGFTYLSPSTAKLRQSYLQTAIVANTAGVTRYPSYFMYQLGYAAPQPSATGHSSASTLGYANVGYHYGSVALGGDTDPANYDGFGPPTANTNASFKGAPQDLNSLTWLNRPFASPYELMYVPMAGPGQLGFYHSVFEHTSSNFRHPFSHMPSYQTSNPSRVDNLSTNSGYWGVQNGAPPPEADWHLLFEFVETDPPFADANSILRPDDVIDAASSNLTFNRFLNSYIPPNYAKAGDPETVRGGTYVAPFNKLPSYVAAGKINLNTMTMQSTKRMESLAALEDGYLAGSTEQLFTRLYESRRGYSSSVASTFFGPGDPIKASNSNLNPKYPTQFAGAFRSPLSASLAPPAVDPTVTAQMRGIFGIETTLQRSLNPTFVGTAPAPNSNPMFSPDSVNGLASQPTELADANHAPFVRSQRMARLPNLVTNQSNVFGVWVTTSLFEYDPVTGFGREYLDETGRPKRERSFYIIDRTIPVGFKPGEDVNTDRVILLKRKLQ